MPHHEFIYRVIDDFLQQKVDAIVLHRSVPEFPNVHARA